MVVVVVVEVVDVVVVVVVSGHVTLPSIALAYSRIRGETAGLVFMNRRISSYCFAISYLLSFLILNDELLNYIAHRGLRSSQSGDGTMILFRTVVQPDLAVDLALLGGTCF